MNKKPYYLTTAIAYASSKPHIGNTYEAILSDSMARFKRLDGYDVFFQTGTDEHGQKIQKNAEAAGVTPQEFVDNIVEGFHKLASIINEVVDTIKNSKNKADKLHMFLRHCLRHEQMRPAQEL